MDGIFARLISTSWIGLLAGVGLILVSTLCGVGVIHESVYHISVAENLLSMSGLRLDTEGGERMPLTYYPPRHLSFLAGIGLLGVDLVNAARTLAAILFNVNL